MKNFKCSFECCTYYGFCCGCCREVNVGTKNHPGRYDVDLSKIDPDEPFFILRAKDNLAADLVELWALRAKSADVDYDKVREAFDCAEEMRRWKYRRDPD